MLGGCRAGCWGGSELGPGCGPGNGAKGGLVRNASSERPMGAVSEVRNPHPPQFVCKCLWVLPGSSEVQGQPQRPLGGVSPMHRAAGDRRGPTQSFV